jgi:hypothetical protein
MCVVTPDEPSRVNSVIWRRSEYVHSTSGIIDIGCTPVFLGGVQAMKMPMDAEIGHVTDRNRPGPGIVPIGAMRASCAATCSP